MWFRFRLTTERDAHEIAEWHYHEPYTFYDFKSDPEDLAKLLNPERWK